MENIIDRSQSIFINSYVEYYSRVVDFITYRINNRCEAEDLAQDVFVRLLEYRQMLSKETVKNFIYTISCNIITDYLRRYYRMKIINNYLYDEIPSSTNDVEENILASDISRLEKSKLSTFPKQRKQIYYLSRFEDFSIDEIASQTSLKRRTVECHLYIARKEMRMFLKQCI